MICKQSNGITANCVNIWATHKDKRIDRIFRIKLIVCAFILMSRYIVCHPLSNDIRTRSFLLKDLLPLSIRLFSIPRSTIHYIFFTSHMMQRLHARCHHKQRHCNHIDSVLRYFVQILFHFHSLTPLKMKKFSKKIAKVSPHQTKPQPKIWKKSYQHGASLLTKAKITYETTCVKQNKIK